ncbi:MAG: SAM-dependent methyltransferase, partial [Candidatus Aenigmatarchaeota archaeon]
YGALLEEISELEKAGIDYEIIPGVTAMTAAASVLKTSLTVPEKLQTIVIVRPSCRTPIRGDIAKLLQAARDVSTIAIYLGSSCIHNIVDLLIRAGYSKDTEVAIVYRATWRDQKTFICTLNNIENILKENNISGDYIVLIGPPIHTHTKTHQPRSLVYSVK